MISSLYSALQRKMKSQSKWLKRIIILLQIVFFNSIKWECDLQCTMANKQQLRRHWDYSLSLTQQQQN